MLLLRLAPFAAASCFFAPCDGGGNEEEGDDSSNGGNGQGEIERRVCAFCLDRKPQIVHGLCCLNAELCKRFAARKRLIVGVGDRAFNDLFVHVLLCSCLRRGVTDVVQVRGRNIRTAEEVDERFRALLVLAALWDAHGINKDVEALPGKLKAR